MKMFPGSINNTYIRVHNLYLNTITCQRFFRLWGRVPSEEILNSNKAYDDISTILNICILSAILVLFPGGGGNSNMEQTGMLVGNFEFNP